MIKKLLLPFLALAIVTSSCKKDEDEEDTQPPSVSISTPETGDVVSRGDTLDIRATATDDIELLTVEIIILNDNSEVFSSNRLYSGTSAQMDTIYRANVPANTELEVIVRATDKAGNKGEQSRTLDVVQ
ncbi:MAG: DUF4625 domain-containing protein [Bacteroidia bacterium]